MSLLLRKYRDDFAAGRSFDAADAEALLDALITETVEQPIADVLTAWNAKGVSSDEIYEFARILRSRMNRVNSVHETFVDIVGTGGSSAKTFNVSTAASFVVAGAGVAVAKHGNKAATSNSGSADVLSVLGIDPAVSPETAETCLNTVGICFMFAPNFHRLSPTLAKVRRGLGFPTIFNCVGPLCNPASAPHQLIGVWDKELVPKMAEALARLVTKRSWIVHGEDGLDEISPTGRTFVAEIEGDSIRRFEIAARDFGLGTDEPSGLRSRDSAHSGEMIRGVLLGQPHSQSAEDLVLVNAAAALFISNAADSFENSVDMARESLTSGAAHNKLEELAAAAPIK
ncbi:MAG: anthranilate phosphoribosyltransferase [Acidobacteria bacterium]|nr:anthranilate phosphoribosyltransferase [Acidobacteriota bacterium]